ncbi:hypothetical protein VpasPP24_8 [Vibrio phage Vpas_PP24]|nr:hypothetical protein VpasPP24_8 [Vibrio phage Vpas_PP24]
MTLQEIYVTRAKLDALVELGRAFNCPMEARAEIRGANDLLKGAEEHAENAEQHETEQLLNSFAKYLDRAIEKSSNVPVLLPALQDIKQGMAPTRDAFPPKLVIPLISQILREVEAAHMSLSNPKHENFSEPPKYTLATLSKYSAALSLIRDHLSGKQVADIQSILTKAKKYALQLITENGDDYRLRDVAVAYLNALD